MPGYVWRAIGQMKVFSNLKKALPITLAPLIDDILVVCAIISNNLFVTPTSAIDFFSSSNINNFNNFNFM